MNPGDLIQIKMQMVGYNDPFSPKSRMKTFLILPTASLLVFIKTDQVEPNRTAYKLLSRVGLVWVAQETIEDSFGLTYEIINENR